MVEITDRQSANALLAELAVQITEELKETYRSQEAAAVAGILCGLAIAYKWPEYASKLYTLAGVDVALADIPSWAPIHD